MRYPVTAGANRAAHRLIAEGVTPRDRVVWWGPTVLDALELAYGISKAGGTLAPILLISASFGPPAVQSSTAS